MSDSRRPNSFFCRLAECFAAVFLMLPLFGQNVSYSAANAGFNDGIDRNDPNFVTASLLIMSPGDELYSCAGHACLRLECPTFNLDYCFSYESESVKEKVLTFFMGKLKMGMFAVPTEDYLKLGRESGRGVMQYHLNLPPEVKQRLWKLLDDKVAEGPNLPYDYLERGCAQSLFVALSRVLEPIYPLMIVAWPERFDTWTRREFVDAAVRDFPWTRFFLYTIVGSEADRDVTKRQKVVIPGDLPEILALAEINGRPIVDAEGTELLPEKPRRASMAVSPLMVSWGFVVLAVANYFAKSAYIGAFLLVAAILLGLLLTYLVFFSNLTATDWNWLFVPFNPLPALFWKWRRKWALWFAGVLVLWELFMLLSPHRLTDPAYLLLVGAYILFYLKFTRFGADALLASAKSTRSPVAAV